MKRLIIFSTFFFVPFFLFAQVEIDKSRKELRAERKAKIEQSVKSLVESNEFVFVVRTANPAEGPSISLTSDYDIKITKDSVYSYLPYFGEAYKIDYGSTDGGIKFEAIVYNYELSFNEKSKFYEIQFEVIEKIEAYKIYLRISSSGYGNLKIISNARQMISYDGILSNLLEN